MSSPTTHPELPIEQAYLDRAYAHLARMRARTKAATEIADNAAQEVDSAIAKAHLNARLKSLDTEIDGLAFGRLDADAGDTWYVGRRHVEDERGRSRGHRLAGTVSTPFYRATAADPLELRRRRRFLMTAPRRRPSTRCSTIPTASTPPTTAASRIRCSPSSNGRARARCATSSPRSRRSRTW